MLKTQKQLSLIFSLVLIILMCGSQALSDTYFKKTECQIHADINRVPPSNNNDIWTLTVEHFSEWKYGDTFLFMDLESEPTFRQTPNAMYFEIAPRFNLDKILKQDLIVSNFLGDLYLAFQYNGADKPYIPTSWLGGVSVDILGQPNYGFSNISLYIKDCDRKGAFKEKAPYQNDTSWQITFVWGQPFNVGPLQMEFNGFLDYWQENSLNNKDETYRILLTEPQLRLKLSSFTGKDQFLSNSIVGTEVEISNHFFGEKEGWRINPTLFFAVVF
ncbi:MAG: outer membrane channel-forming protein [Candidatus Magnetoglobus multicellularis str. Araruama]|uniref:Outer membrane channel-forming protein n=1 Tax=Candidatus Magnetoglobus multicellularis str. Araruama TaxID=890399 RepID=A0A1V1PHF2_9BACT|nr:MAG: outer membrane channel-forming protein [Candidatus Magnetoglobus multicellularis str. Araruama]